MTSRAPWVRILLPVGALLLASCGDGNNQNPGVPTPSAPTAVAGTDQTVFEGEVFLLDGSSSSDEDGDIEVYQWDQVGQASDPRVSLGDGRFVSQTFVAPDVNGTRTLVFELTVFDATQNADADAVRITVVDRNQTPTVTASAGASSGNAGDQIDLMSTANDVDGTIASVRWQQTEGTGGDIDTPTDANTFVTLPDVTVPESLTFEMTVTDNEGRRNSAIVNIFVNPVAANLEFRVLANTVESDFPWSTVEVAIVNSNGQAIRGGAAANYTVGLRIDTGVGTLNGTLSQQALAGVAAFDDLSYTDPDTNLILEAFVADPPLSTLSNVVTVEETNLQPTVNAGTDANVAAGDMVTLMGSGSDPDGTIALYQWAQLQGPAVILSDQRVAMPTFTAPDVVEPSALVFELTVFDDMGKPNTDDVTITVQPVADSIAFVGPTLPTSILRNAPWPDVEVEIRNASGNRITGGAPSVLTVQLTTMGSGSLSMPTSLAANDGAALFSGLFYDTAENDVVIQAEALTTGLTAQAPSVDVQWSSQLPGGFGSDGAETVHDMVLVGETSPDIVVAGSFETSGMPLQPALDGSASTVASNGVDGYVFRYSSTGTLGGARYLSGPGNEVVRAIALAGNNDLITGFSFDAMADLRDTTLDGMGPAINVTPQGGDDVGLARLQPAPGGASMLWAASFGNANDDLVNGIFVDGNTAFVVGEFTGAAVDLDPCDEADTATPGDTTVTNGFVTAIDLSVLDGANCASAPAALWSVGIGSTEPARAVAITEDLVTGSLYIGGTFGGTVDFDPGIGVTSRMAPGGAQHAFLLKLSSSGDFQWVRTFGGDSGVSVVNAVTLDADSNIWSVGTFEGDGFNPGFVGAVDSAGGRDIFVTSHLTNGDFRAPVSFVLASGTNEDAWDIAAGPNTGDDLVVVGTFSGTLDVNPDLVGSFELTTPGPTWGFAMEMSPSSTFSWGGRWGSSTGDSAARRVGVVGSGSAFRAFVASEVSGTLPADLDPFTPSVSYTSYGSFDGVLTKFAGDGAVAP